LTFDQDGKKIGLSKGSPTLGEKALLNRIDKIGIQNLTGLTVYTKNRRFGTHISILQKIGERPDYIDLTISIPFFGKISLDYSLDLFCTINEFVNINYGYSYKASNYISLIGEDKYSKPFLYSIVQRSKDDWDNQIKYIKNGQLKKIYLINCLNSIQYEQNKKSFSQSVKLPNTDLTIATYNK